MSIKTVYDTTFLTFRVQNGCKLQPFALIENSSIRYALFKTLIIILTINVRSRKSD